MPSRSKEIAKRTKTTVLIVGEGPTEKAFLGHLRELYIIRDGNVAVKVECGTGGAPVSIVQKAIRLCGSRAYDKCYVLIDSHIPFNPDYKLSARMNRRPRIEILKATPCIEGLLLAILEYPNFSQASSSSDNCKRDFEKRYLTAEKKTDKRSYSNKFPKTLLDSRRSNIPELNLILQAMQV